mmetsp:Transcript_11139/g.18694  ORF Transcript_11139/g.18694 Transcript_11139/m.18694 type:complete len:82 (+) Transcript_11139:662-907(+)
MQYLKRGHEMGVRNIEMESLFFGAFCNKIKVRSMVVCTALLNRLDGDQVNSSMEQLQDYESRPVKLILEFIKQDYEKHSQK